MRNLSVFKIFIAVGFFLTVRLANAANESPQTFTLDGQLYAADRTSPLLDAAARIKVQILDPSRTCILYEEEQPVDTTTSNGHFTIQVGSVIGSTKRKAFDPGNTMQKVYQNSSAITALGPSCSGTYSPVLGAIRYVRVIVTPSAQAPTTLTPDMVLDAVPNAVVAQSLQGLEKENILQSNPAMSVTQSKLEQFFAALSLAPGSSVKFDGTNYVPYDPSNGANLTAGSVPNAAIASVTWAKITSLPNGISAIASLSCANGEILKMVSGSWACATESGVGSESDPTVSAYAKSAPGAGLTVSGGAIVADFGTGTGKVVQGNDARLSDSRAPNGSASGDLSGSYPSPTVAKLQGRGVSVTAPADGQILRYNNGASQWEPFNFGIGDLKTNAGTPQFISASCTASETLIWSSVTNTFSCTTIGIAGSQVTGNIAGNAANVTGTVAIANGGTGQTTAAAALNALLPSQSGQNGKVLQTNGTMASWQTPALSGMTSLNGSSQASQTFATPGATGTSPNWSTNTGTGVHTLNIPMASTAGVTAGLISKTDYDNFSSKLSSESDPKVGANTANYLSKWNGTALVASGIYESGGSVGIGTTSPVSQLMIWGVGQATANLDTEGALGGVIALADAAGVAGNGGGIVFGANSSGIPKRFAAIKSLITSGAGNTAGDLAFSTRTLTTDSTLTEKMRITANGNVGIGTTSPLAPLHVKAPILPGAHSNRIVQEFTDFYNGGTNGQNLAISTLTSGANYGGWNLSSDWGGRLSFGVTAAANVGTSPNEYLSIISNGNVGIGTSVPDQLLSVNGNASKVGGGSWATFSDRRLKTVEGDFTRGLNEVLNLQPVAYHYNDGNPMGLPNEGTHIGFVAQEIQKEIPEAVTENQKGYLMVNNDPIIWTMFNAIKEFYQHWAEADKKTQLELAQVKQENAQMRQENAQLKSYLCAKDPGAPFCP